MTLVAKFITSMILESFTPDPLPYMYSVTVSHARDDQSLHQRQHDALPEEASQLAETDQEADALAFYVTDVFVPAEVTIEQDAQVFNTPALLYSLATDPHADR